MLMTAAWCLFALGILHVLYGVVWFKTPVKEALAQGFIGQFMGIEARRLAFWFIIFGPLLAMGGHIAVYAVSHADYGLIKIIGFYTFGISLVSVLALPKSPFWGALLLAPVFIAGGYGWIS
ncbi:MAG: DUF6463 family protein [Pseudomonas sp.]|uniref:DUF6463 family protein n=1 Tax=Pseudomonas sp. TaxID=306 RepID=UPI0033950B4C